MDYNDKLCIYFFSIKFALYSFETIKILKMSGSITFTMIKPDAVADGNVGAILAKITEGGFKIKAMKFTKMNQLEAMKFYEIHSGKPFFDDLVKFMSSGEIVAAVLEKENAVEDFRKLIGSTNPSNAEEGTIRKIFARSINRNAVHGSDSDENAEKESLFHFSGRELL